MNLVEETFQKVEFNKFVEQKYESIPEDKLNELNNVLQKYKYRINSRDYFSRLSLLKKESPDSNEYSYYTKIYGVRGVKKIYVSNGEVVYKLPVFCFPSGTWRAHYTNCYLIIGKQITLIDCGTSYSESSFEEGFKVIQEFYGEKIKIEDIDNIIITHSHIDHFGGLSFLIPICKAKVFAHEMDAEAITNVEESHIKINKTLEKYLRQAGVPLEVQTNMVQLHREFKKVLFSYPITDTLSNGDLIINGYKIIHTPGHCPGSICIRNGDVMFLGDNILMGITPHQFPKLYMKGMGLIHYIPSLLKICSNVQNICLGLPAHNEEILDIKARALEIINSHHERLSDLLTLLDEPKSLYDVTEQYFSEIVGKELKGFDKVLAVEEIGAHLEYMAEALNCIDMKKEYDSEKNEFILYRRK